MSGTAYIWRNQEDAMSDMATPVVRAFFDEATNTVTYMVSDL